MMTRASCQFGLKCIDEQITLGLLKQLETRKATGMDGIFSRLLKLTAPGVAGSLTQLFNYSSSYIQISPAIIPNTVPWMLC